MKNKIGRLYGRLRKHAYIIVNGHLLNWPWRTRDERRRYRYKATRESALKYLNRYKNSICLLTAPQISLEAEPERAFSIWFQGEENAPEIVKSCFRSMRRNLHLEVVILNEKTLFDWIEIPDFIVEKWKSGKMSAAHFCDICRVDLIYRHGGIWMDATDFVTRNIPDWIMDQDFFIFMSGDKIRGSYSFVQNCFFRAKKGNRLLGLWREAIINYWKDEDSVINYFTHHLLFETLVKNNLLASNEFAKMPKVAQDSTHTVWDFHKKDVFDKELFDALIDESFFQKTEYKSKVSRDPLPGSFAEVISNM